MGRRTRHGCIVIATALSVAVAACGIGDDANPPTTSGPMSPTATGDDSRPGRADGDDPDRATSPSVDEPRPTTAAGSTTTDRTTSPPATTIPATTAPTTTEPSTTAPMATTAPSDPVVDDDGSGTEGDDIVDDDPSFRLGPDVVLEIDLARFPPDDAGVGGEATQPDADGESTTDRAPVTGWAAVDRFLGDTLLRSGNTAASVAVSIDGDIVHSAAFGVRDPATGDPAGPDDRFRVASISKPITALVLMHLVETGVVGLDEPIGQRIADHVGLDAVSGGSRSLTLRQLLTHRSGFGKYQSTFFRAGATDCADAARQGLSSGAGGGGYTYSNMNYCLAGLAIEALTGLGYEAAVYRELLTPLGISGMRLAPTFDPGPGEVQHVTTPGRNYMETLGAAGAWVASPSELVTILDALDLSTAGYKPLELGSALEMITPQGGSLGQRGYGLGLISYGGGRFGHTGTIESTHAMLLNRGDGVSWAITVAGQFPSESTALEGIMNDAFAAGGFVAG